MVDGVSNCTRIEVVEFETGVKTKFEGAESAKNGDSELESAVTEDDHNTFEHASTVLATKATTWVVSDTGEIVNVEFVDEYVPVEPARLYVSLPSK